ncbi:MAG: hypothetical protein V1793_00645 [Pseudomonadota bacterium]
MTLSVQYLQVKETNGFFETGFLKKNASAQVDRTGQGWIYPNMVNKIFSAGFLVFFAVSSCVFFIIALGIFLVTRFFDPRLVILHLFSSFWAMVYLWVLPGCTVKIQGRQKLDWNSQYIIVSNHQSQMDILIAFGLFFSFKWVSKTESMVRSMIACHVGGFQEQSNAGNVGSIQEGI